MLTHAGGIPRNRIVGCGLAAALFASIAAVQMLAMISHPGEALYVAPVAPHGAAADLLANHRDTQATTGADG